MKLSQMIFHELAIKIFKQEGLMTLKRAKSI